MLGPSQIRHNASALVQGGLFWQAFCYAVQLPSEAFGNRFAKQSVSAIKTVAAKVKNP